MDSVGLTDLQNDMQHNGFRRPGETQEWFQDGFRRSYDLQKTYNTMGFGGQVKRRSASRMDSVGLTDLQNDMQHNGFRRPGETQEWFQDGFRRSYDLQKTYNTMGFGGQVKRRSASRMDSVGLTDLQNDMQHNGLRRPGETRK